MRRLYKVVKHALGSFDEEDGYNRRNENAIALVRSVFVLTNLICAIFIMINIVKGW